MELAQGRDGLASKRDNVLLAHLHALSRNAPLCAIEIEFRPACSAQLSGTYKDKRRQLQSGGRGGLPS